MFHQTNQMQTAAVHSRHPLQRRNGLVCCFMALFAANALQCIFIGDEICPWWPWPLTWTFKLVWVRDQTCLPCEFGANPFSSSRDIWCPNKKKWKSHRWR